ncbi:MAG: HAD family phosphatase [Thermoguttaceae bacterium]|jgi:FMN phosphatase YigB (HAD superfamily)
MTPKFIFFDLGKVLVDFSFERMFHQMAQTAGIEPQRVQAVLAAGLQVDYEIGILDSRAAHEVFCRQTGTRPDYEMFSLACNDIFTPIDSMLPVVSQLFYAGHRLGILSNTCKGHWNHCLQRYTMFRDFFSVYALSFEIGAAKPDKVIFCKAAELAGCQPKEIFYTDDILGHVAGARSVGLDAVVYTSTAELVKELWRRGVKFNY